MGFGQSACPRVPPNDIALYGYKRASDDFAELARQLGLSSIVLGGHDWGGMVVWRFALHHPRLVSHVFSVCTPYTPPHEEYLSLEALVAGPLPQFGYQLHLCSPEVEGRITTPEQISQFLRGMYGGRSPTGEVCFSPRKGVLFDVLPRIGRSPLLDDKEVDYYVDQYSNNGLHGTVNWYRTRHANWQTDLELLKDPKIKQPSLFVQATKDSVLKPEMAQNMGKYIPNLTFAEVEAQHWALWEKPERCNEIIKDWLEQVVLGGRSKL
jgi:soluble epoxide hydrolase / lipid-phosphate phosphatase